MPTKTTTRPASYAVNKLFKDSLATFRNEIFMVTDIVSDKSITLDHSVYESMKQRMRLFDPNITLNLPEIENKDDPSEYYPEFIEKVPIKSIKKVICKMDEDLLQSFICRNCRSFIKRTSQITSTNKFIFTCPFCSSREDRRYLSQAPLLLYNRKIPQNRTPPKLLKAIPGRKCQNCLKNNRESWMGLYIKNKERPMYSLTRRCLDCDHEEPLKVMPYRPVQPSEQLTKGITVSIATAKNQEPLEFIDLFNKDYVEGLYFSEKVQVSEVTFGYKLGQFMSTITKGFGDEYFGRKFDTQGFFIQLKESAFEEARKKLKEIYKKDPELFAEFQKDIEAIDSMKVLQLKRWVLHSLQNALLVILPIYTGLPTNEFSGTYDLEKNQVIIYDNQEGGIGGAMKFKESPELFFDYLDTIIRTITRCDCRNKCPKCIALDNDGEVNQALNRHLLNPIFENIETSYD